MNILNIEHISKIYGEKTIFEDASFGIHEGDKIGIIGINGTGKTTLLRMVAGIEERMQDRLSDRTGCALHICLRTRNFPKMQRSLPMP